MSHQSAYRLLAVVDFALVAVHLYLYTFTGSLWNIFAALIAAGVGVWAVRK